MNLADLVMRIREKADSTQQAIAERLGVDRSTLSKLVNGKRGESYDLGMKILALACERGLVREVLLVLGTRSDETISTLMRASILFPSLSPAELSALREVERATGGTEPLPEDTVRFVVETLRANAESSASVVEKGKKKASS